MAYVANDTFAQRPDLATMLRAIQGHGQPPPQGFGQPPAPMPPQQMPQQAPASGPPVNIMPQQMQQAPQAPGPQGNMLGNNYQSMIMAGLGLMGGANKSEQMQGLAQGYAYGAAMDNKRQKDAKEEADKQRKEQQRQYLAQALGKLSPQYAEAFKNGDTETMTQILRIAQQDRENASNASYREKTYGLAEREQNLREEQARAKSVPKLEQLDPDKITYDPITRQPVNIGGTANPNAVTPGKLKIESGLREEWRQNKTVQNFETIQDSYRNILKAATTKNASGPSDISLVYAFMKMQDPNSAVRETEYATAENAGGIDAKVWGLFNRLRNGERLKPELRQEFAQSASELYDAQAGRYEAERSRFEDIANQSGADPKRVLSPYKRIEIPKPSATNEPGAPGAAMPKALGPGTYDWTPDGFRPAQPRAPTPGNPLDYAKGGFNPVTTMPGNPLTYGR